MGVYLSDTALKVLSILCGELKRRVVLRAETVIPKFAIGIYKDTKVGLV